MFKNNLIFTRKKSGNHIICLFSVFNKKEKDPALKVVSKNVSVAEVDNTIKGFEFCTRRL